MNWSKAMAVGYVASIVLGAVIGGSFAPAWSGYVVLTGLALLPLIIFLKPEAIQSMSRHHFAEKFKMAFGGISAWLWGIVIFSIAGSVLLAVTDTEKSGTHELVTPILQSIVAAFVFYVIDVVYPKNKRNQNAKQNYLRPLKALTQRAFFPLRYLSKENPNRIFELDTSPENIKALLIDFNQYDDIPSNPKINLPNIDAIKIPTFKDEWCDTESFTKNKANLAIQWYGEVLPPKVHDLLFKLTQSHFFIECSLYLKMNEVYFGHLNICQHDHFIKTYSEYLSLCAALDNAIYDLEA